MSIKQELEELRQRALTELKAIKDNSGFVELEIKYLGRKGELANAFKSLKTVVTEEKPALGELVNQVKEEVEQAFNKVKARVFSLGQTRPVDFTIPGLKPAVGHSHPVLQVQRDLENLFRSMGFQVLDGPELESEYYNFEALNIPAWHPARDTQDTFYVKGGSEDNRWLLRTHTSNMQVRALEKYGAPLRVVVPGRVFRYEATDASHDTQFWQMEGLVVDKDISISHLIATMKALLTGIFQREVEVRLRPGYFPFVEPGFELDIKCLVCGGKGCSVCKQSGWVELLPCGLVHPKVLQYGGLNSAEYSGFAFGLGLSRLVMMRYKIDDIRLFLAGDMRFLEQF
ncbi:MAG TPA: phenylalanine--tRNA ligase subunit alpha [Candidatus Veblenbacteria bacterium]|nr:phenylalanine--tRNA ligase subunit alpha [Candidatus Veblenbacteria bacterium]